MSIENCSKSNSTKLAYARPVSALGEPSSSGRDIIVLNDHESRMSPYEVARNAKMHVNNEMSTITLESNVPRTVEEVTERTKRKYKTPTPEPFEIGLLKMVADNHRQAQQSSGPTATVELDETDDVQINGKKRNKNSKLK